MHGSQITMRLTSEAHNTIDDAFNSAARYSNDDAFLHCIFKIEEQKCTFTLGGQRQCIKLLIEAYDTLII